MSLRVGIPTGSYQLHRVPTPLDPTPKGPVYDGGILVDDGRAGPISPGHPSHPLGQIAPVASTPLTPADLRSKYTVTDIPQTSVAVFTIPRRVSLADALVDSYKVRASAHQPQAVTDDTFSMLMQTGRFNETSSSPTTIGVCGFVRNTDHLRGEPLKTYLAQKGIIIPCIEHLVAACIIHHSVTGRHLVPDGRVTRALNGAVELKRSQLRIHFDNPERFDTSPHLVVAGIVKPGQQSPVVGKVQKFLQRLKAIF